MRAEEAERLMKELEKERGGGWKIRRREKSDKDGETGEKKEGKEEGKEKEEERRK